MTILLKRKKVQVFAPATVANVGSGFDVFGFALNRPGDAVCLTVKEKPGLVIQAISGDQGVLPLAPSQNTAGKSVRAMLDYLKADFGLAMKIEKQMPIGSGLGSSAASSVAGVFALNNLLAEPLSKEILLEFAIEGEKIASGESVHLDNIAACLYGGFILVRSKQPIDIVNIPVPDNLHCTVIHPRIEIRTSESRKILKAQVPLERAVRQWANVAGVVTALFQQDFPLLQRSLVDEIAEPERSILIPFYAQMKEAAKNAGAAGFGISGSGPSVFALSDSPPKARFIAKQLSEVLNQHQIENDVYVSVVNQNGPVVLSGAGE